MGGGSENAHTPTLLLFCQGRIDGLKKGGQGSRRAEGVRQEPHSPTGQSSLDGTPHSHTPIRPYLLSLFLVLHLQILHQLLKLLYLFVFLRQNVHRVHGFARDKNRGFRASG